MTSSKPFLLTAILCAGIIAGLAACTGDRPESFYSSLADADKDGAITRGWIPEFLPESSRNIHEIHEISPENEWCAFEFPPADSQRLRKTLKSIEALPSPLKRVPSPAVRWWPTVLKGNLDLAKIHGAGLELYVVETPATSVTTDVLLFAIDWTKGHGYFYGTHEPSSIHQLSPD